MKKLLSLIFLTFSFGCATVNMPPPVPPGYHMENLTVYSNSPVDVNGAIASLVSDSGVSVGDTVTANRVTFNVPNGLTGGATFTVVKDGFETYVKRDYVFCLSTCEQPAVELQLSFPAPPTRDQALNVHITFQGLTVSTERFGQIPWFEDGLFSPELTDKDRAEIYAIKHSSIAWPNGDTHAIIQYDDNLGSIYDEPGTIYQQFHGRGFEHDCQGFRSAVIEVVRNGFTALVFLGGDDGESGYPVAVRQLPEAISCLEGNDQVDLNPYVVYLPGWDGVFYGWTKEHIYEFGAQFRSILPFGYLGIEHQPGRIPTGEGDRDYVSGGGMRTYDLLMSEFDQPFVPNDDTIWQVGGRLLGPAYSRGPEQPADDDPNPPFYLHEGTERGRYYACAFEWTGEYFWIRNQQTQAQQDQQRQYLKDRGWSCGG